MKQVLFFAISIFHFAFAEGQTNTIKVKKQCGCDTIVLTKTRDYFEIPPADTAIQLAYINARVLSADGGRIIQGAVISIYGSDSGYISVRTNKAGVYIIGNIPYGKYILKYCAENYKTCIKTVVFNSSYYYFQQDIRLEQCD